MIPIQWEFRDLIVGITYISCIVMDFINLFLFIDYPETESFNASD